MDEFADCAEQVRPGRRAAGLPDLRGRRRRAAAVPGPQGGVGMTGSAVRVLTWQAHRLVGPGRDPRGWRPRRDRGSGHRPRRRRDRGRAGSTDALFGHRHPEDGLGRRGPRPQGPDAGSPLGRYPLLSAPAGRPGMDAGVAWVQQIALEEGFVLRVACLFSELPPAQAEKLRSAGRVRPRGPAGLAGRCYARPLQPRRRPHGARADRSCRPGRR